MTPSGLHIAGGGYNIFKFFLLIYSAHPASELAFFFFFRPLRAHSSVAPLLLLPSLLFLAKPASSAMANFIVSRIAPLCGTTGGATGVTPLREAVFGGIGTGGGTAAPATGEAGCKPVVLGLPVPLIEGDGVESTNPLPPTTITNALALF
ncbi:hypothetical protein GQX74_008041 [Glossina fuscipes]|nr:hypothetical protein GQX74_008041 [Glossina fuscipes]